MVLVDDSERALNRRKQPLTSHEIKSYPFIE